MKIKSAYVVFAVILITGFIFAKTYNQESDYTGLDSKELKQNAAHVNYNKMMDVLTSPRCINCHPNDHVPKQGDDSHPHYFGMKRGEDGHGFEATKCATCHQDENNRFSGVPGSSKWALAPHSMKWEGLTRKEIAESMMDPERNGGRSPEETLHHLTEDELVLWAWEPGVRANGVPREKPPVPLEEYKKAVKAWIEGGAIIPEN